MVLEISKKIFSLKINFISKFQKNILKAKGLGPFFFWRNIFKKIKFLDTLTEIWYY